MRSDDQGLTSRSTAPEALFREAWEEIGERMARLRQELELAERHGLGEETKTVLARKLAALQKTVDEFTERWMDFERKKRTLEDRLDGVP